MKLIEKLAEEYRYHGEHAIEDLQDAYIAGFIKAKDMCMFQINQTSLRGTSFNESQMRACIVGEILGEVFKTGEEEINE